MRELMEERDLKVPPEGRAPIPPVSSKFKKETENKERANIHQPLNYKTPTLVCMGTDLLSAVHLSHNDRY